ncbi:phospholipase D family protein [Chlamydia pecorum]|nr:phospholipase D family protein [Chlamydia pecorum]
MSTRSVGGASSRYHPYSSDQHRHHHHHGSSREDRGFRRSEGTSRSSRDYYRRHGHEGESRESRRSDRHGHRSEGRRERERHHHRHHERRHEDVERRVHHAAVPRIPRQMVQGIDNRIQVFSTYPKTSVQPMEVICSAISEAKKKILLKIYHISSEKIIDLLVKQSANIPVCVHYQESPDLESLARGSQIMLDKREGDALLHKKTLLVDSNLVISGSANYTDLSLDRDINLVVKVLSSSLYKVVSSGRHGIANIENRQKVIYYPLHRTRNRIENVRPILDQLNEAQSSIQIAMHTLTQQDIMFALERAILRGVSVKIITDVKEKRLMYPLIKDMKLYSCVYERTCEGTLHSKVCCIDNRILLHGSANWTGGGLNKNLEDVFIIYPLTENQVQSFMELWKFLEENSRPFSPDSEQPSTSSSAT